jgi:5-methylcytosine-specific restriction enzyme B
MTPKMYIPTMKILYGPPGCGKTYYAAREAVRIIDGNAPRDESEFQARYQQLVAGKRIWWVTFHPSFSYEDFVEGFRPTKVESHLIYEVQDGPFKLACQACGLPSPASSIRVGDRMGNDRYEVIYVDPGGVVLKSEVPRKDAVDSQSMQYTDFWTIRRCKELGLVAQDLRFSGQDYKKRVENVARKTQLPTTLLTNSSRHAALWDYLDEKEKNQCEHPVVLVIDEINRADLSRVLGELLTLLEVDKRVGAPEERWVMLPYSKMPFSVPRTLSVVGTMNTTDRSIALIDIALRRRFEFEEVNPDPTLCPKDYFGLDLQTLLEIWNHRIAALRSSDYQLGHSDFMQETLELVAQRYDWGAGEDGHMRALARTIRSKTVPLLLEYFHEDQRKAEAVLGKTGLIKRQDFADVQELVDDIADVTETGGYILEDWWDPLSPSWDFKRFENALSQIIGPEDGK